MMKKLFFTLITLITGCFQLVYGVTSLELRTDNHRTTMVGDQKFYEMDVMMRSGEGGLHLGHGEIIIDYSSDAFGFDPVVLGRVRVVHSELITEDYSCAILDFGSRMLLSWSNPNPAVAEENSELTGDWQVLSRIRFDFQDATQEPDIAISDDDIDRKIYLHDKKTLFNTYDFDEGSTDYDPNNQLYTSVSTSTFLGSCFDADALKMVPPPGATLPDRQPFTDGKWAYPLAPQTTIPSTAVEWIMVEFRNGRGKKDVNNSRQAALLHEDGTITNAYTGLTTFEIPVNTGDSVYTIIRHRAHLPIMSNNPIVDFNNPSAIDFRYEDSYKVGASTGQKVIGFDSNANQDIYGMLPGNMGSGNTPGQPDIIDQDDMEDFIFEFSNSGGYHAYDINADGDVNALDAAVWSENIGAWSAVDTE